MYAQNVYVCAACRLAMKPNPRLSRRLTEPEDRDQQTGTEDQTNHTTPKMRERLTKLQITVTALWDCLPYDSLVSRYWYASCRMRR